MSCYFVLMVGWLEYSSERGDVSHFRMRKSEDFRRSFEDIEFLRFGGEFFLFFVVEGSRSGTLPVLVEQRLGGIVRFEVRFSGGLVWKSSRMGWRSKFGGAVVIFWRSKYLEEL